MSGFKPTTFSSALKELHSQTETKNNSYSHKDIEASLSAGVANPGPAGHFWPTRTFRMALEEFMIEPDRKIVM